MKILEYKFNKRKYHSDILNITILLTLACNLKCIYCYEGAARINDIMIDRDMADRIINFIQLRATNYNIKRINITLFGGEPLLNFDIGKYILGELKKYCYHTSKILSCGIITNGTLLSNEIINELKIYNCNYIQLTLDGPKQIHDHRRMYKDNRGSYDDVISALKLINNRKDFIKAVIRINIDKTNIDSAYQVLEILEEEGLSTHRLDFGVVHGNTESCASYKGNCYIEEELATVLDLLWQKAESCGFINNFNPRRTNMFCGMSGENAFTIDPNGDLYKMLGACWYITTQNW